MLRLASRRLVGSIQRPPVSAPYLRNMASTNPSSENSDPDATASRPQEAEPAGPPEDDTRQHEGVQADRVAMELAKKDAAIAELNDRALRALAEMENVRAIARRDVAQAREFGITAFARGLLVVADNLGLALHAVPEEHLEKDHILQALHTGVKATEAELLKVFRQNGVEQFGAIGDAFDPHRHQALYEAPSDSAAPGMVVDVTKVGYAIGDRVLRPAEVGVSKAAAS